MALSTIWVVAEPASGSFTTTSLELLTAGAHLRRDARRPITWGGDAASPRSRASTARRTLYDVGDLAGALPGVPVASAIASPRGEPGAPDAILIPTSYDGRDIAGRLSARLDRPVLTNVTGLSDDGGLVTEHPIFGGTQTVKARFTGEGPGIFVVRAKSFAAEPSGGAPATVHGGARGRHRSDRHGTYHGHPRRRARRTEARRGRGRGLGRSRTRRGRASTR